MKRWRLLAVLTLLMPAWNSLAAPKEADTQRELREAEQRNSEQLAARKAAADRAEQAAAEALRLAQERVKAAAKLQLAEAATADVADPHRCACAAAAGCRTAGAAAS